MKICIMGSTGILGCAVGKYFLEHRNNDDIYLTYRNELLAYGHNRFEFDPLIDSIKVIESYMPYGIDYIINCIGIIKPFIDKNQIESIKINSIFPRELSLYCHNNNIKLIHITTDCVFSGYDGLYTENSPHDCVDFYGKTKSLGEPDNCMVLRTSIVGEEIHNHASLISWVKTQKDKRVQGFINHLWNGMTTKQYASCCSTIIDNDLYEEQLFHIFSNSTSKKDLLQLISNKFKLNLNINPIEAPQKINRTLNTTKALNQKLLIPSIEEQIKNL